jgi:hypothetical protein
VWLAPHRPRLGALARRRRRVRHPAAGRRFRRHVAAGWRIAGAARHPFSIGGVSALSTGSPLSTGMDSRRDGETSAPRLENRAAEGSRAPSAPTKSPTKWSRLQHSAETHQTRAPRTCSSGTMVRPTETHETTTIPLPRWGSRVRIPSSAQEKEQVRAGIGWPSCICGALDTARGPVSYTTSSRTCRGLSTMAGPNTHRPRSREGVCLR